MMRDYVRDELRRGVMHWAEARGREQDILPRYKGRFMGGREYLGIETFDSAKTLYDLADYITLINGLTGPHRNEFMDALFDERNEDVLGNGRRVIYWPDIPADDGEPEQTTATVSEEVKHQIGDLMSKCGTADGTGAIVAFVRGCKASETTVPAYAECRGSVMATAIALGASIATVLESLDVLDDRQRGAIAGAVANAANNVLTKNGTKTKMRAAIHELGIQLHRI